MSILRTFGNAIRECRVSKGWSQEQLAERAQLDRSYVSGIERGQRNVSILAAMRLSRALGVDLNLLVDPSTSSPGSPPADDREQTGTPHPPSARRRRGSDASALAVPLPVGEQLSAVEAVSQLIQTARRPSRLLGLDALSPTSRQVAR